MRRAFFGSESRLYNINGVVACVLRTHALGPSPTRSVIELDSCGPWSIVPLTRMWNEPIADQVMLDTLNAVTVAGNELWRLLVFFGLVLLSLVAGRLVGFFLARTARSSGIATREWVGVGLRAMARPMVLIFLAAGLWVALEWNVLRMGEGLREFAATVSEILTAAAVGYAIYSLVAVVDYHLKKMASRTESKVDDVLAPLVGKSVRATVAVLVILNVATVISGKSIMTILASLGVGGIAVALSAQDTIRNFFGSLVILGDKPFEIGDRIVIGDSDGPVESVGFRSTRIRTLDGHLVTVPNSEIVNGTVRNISKRPYIRRVATISITYNTPPDKVARALEIVKEILKDHEGINEEFPARVYFTEFSDSSLDLLMIYWYHPPDYWSYLSFTERVNMEILHRFNEEGIEFAFPTHTLYVENAGQGGLDLNPAPNGIERT